MEFEQFRKEMKLMSNEFTGKVLRIVKDKIKSGPNEGNSYYKVTMEDVEGEQVMFNAWDFGAIRGVNVGDMALIDYNVTADGKYKHINSATPVKDINEDDDIPFDSPIKKTIEPPAPPRKTIPTSQIDSRELGIYRQSALKGAIEYLAGSDADIEMVIDTAKRFVEFDITGE